MLSVDYQEDLAWFDSVLKRYPKNPQLWYIFGIFESNCSHKEEAIEAYKKGFALNNNLPNIQQWIAFQYYTLGQLTLARSYALRSLDRNAGSVYSRFIKIMTQEDDDRIVEELRQLIDQNQEYLVPRHELGQIYFNNGSYERALKCYLDCTQRSKFYDSAKIGAARCYIELKMPESAISILESYIEEIGPEEGEEPFLILAFAYKQVEEFSKAFEMIDIARQRNALNEKINLLEAEVYVKQNRYGKAIETLLGILKRDPDEVQTIKYTATIYLKMGQVANAENWSSIYKKHKPLDLQLDFTFAQFYLEHSQHDRALQIYEELLQNEGVESEVYPKVINIYSQLGQYDEALRHSRKWSDEEPHNPSSWEKISEITLLISAKIRNKEWEPKRQRRDK